MFLACFLEFQQLTKVATSVFITAPWDPGNRLHICEILPGKWRVVESSKRPSHLKYRLLMTAELFTKQLCTSLVSSSGPKIWRLQSRVEPGGQPVDCTRAVLYSNWKVALVKEPLGHTLQDFEGALGDLVNFISRFQALAQSKQFKFLA